jgi:hypothetical protein
MTPMASIRTILLLTAVPTHLAVAASIPPALEPFLGEPILVPMQHLWTGRGGTNIVAARDGTVIAFQSHGSNKIRRSRDGGRTWPVKRLAYDGPSAYSNLAAGRAGTPSQGMIFLLFEGGPAGHHSAIQVVAFNLSWLLDTRGLSEFVKGGTGS